MKHKPREGDLPVAELLKAAQFAVGPKGQWPGASLHFKFTCEHCGERCMFQDDNVLYEYGECHVCGKKTKVEFGGFSIHYVLGKERHES